MVCNDPVTIDFSRNSSFDEMLKAMQIEYFASTFRRLPSLLKFPKHHAKPGVETRNFTQDVAATFNFLSFRSRQAPEDDECSTLDGDSIQFGNTISEDWHIPLWPMYLRVWEDEVRTRGAFLFNAGVISSSLQARFIEIFSTELHAALSSSLQPRV
jgi:hypothetical protein